MAEGIEAPEGGNKTLNRMVAVTVVALAVFLGLCNIKAENLVQTMEVTKADAVDTWNEYQATKIKLHVDEDALIIVDAIGLPAAKAQAEDHLAKRAAFVADIEKYNKSAPALQAKARAFDAKHEELNIHDDQFDACEALIGIAISIAAVAAVAESIWVLLAAWVFGVFGVLMGVAAFIGWPLHPDFLAALLS